MNGEITGMVKNAFGSGKTWSGAGLVIVAPLMYVVAKLLLGEVDNILAGLIGAVSGLGAQMMGSGVMDRVHRDKDATYSNGKSDMEEKKNG